jgi:hypothetical protein
LNRLAFIPRVCRRNLSNYFAKFSAPAEAQSAEIARIAETFDKHRKNAQARYPDITLTEMYNVLEKMRANEVLSNDDKLAFDKALILKELHEELDAAVAETYGWPVDLPEQELLARLVALNKVRAAEKVQLEADFGDEEQKPTTAAKSAKPSFPSDPVEQVAGVMAALAASEGQVSAAQLSQTFKQGRKVEARVAATLSSLARTGFIASASRGAAFSLRRPN